MSWVVFHTLDDRLCAADIDKQKRKHLCEAEVKARLDVR